MPVLLEIVECVCNFAVFFRDIELELEYMYEKLEKGLSLLIILTLSYTNLHIFVLVLENVQATPEAEPFQFPVSKEEVVDYYDVIKVTCFSVL